MRRRTLFGLWRQLYVDEYDPTALLSTLPTKFNIADVCVDKWVSQGRGDRPAIYLANRAMSYRELQTRVYRLASGLRELGLKKGDRFLIRLPDSLLFYVAFLAGLRIGAVAIPTSQLLGYRELKHILGAASVKLVITSDEAADPVRALRAESPELRGGSMQPDSESV